MNDITIAVTETGHRYIAPDAKSLNQFYSRFRDTISDVRNGLHYEQLHLYECVCVEGKYRIAKINDCPDDHETFFHSCVVPGCLTCIGRDAVAVLECEHYQRTKKLVASKP